MKAEVERYKLVRDDAHTHMSTLRESSEATTSLVDSLQTQLNEARAKIERYEAISVTSPPATWSPKQSVSPTSSEELPTFAQIGFDKNANDISTLQMEEPDLVVTVEVGDGVAHDIEVSKDDDVKIIAKQFVTDHGLEEDAIPALVAYIGEQLDAAREEEEEGEEEAEEEEEEEEEEALEELKQQQPPTDSKRPSRRPPPQPNSPGSRIRSLSNLPPPPIPPAPTGMEDNISGNVDDDKEKEDIGTPNFLPPPPPPAFAPPPLRSPPPPPPVTPPSNIQKTTTNASASASQSQSRRKARMRRVSQLMEKQKKKK